MSARKTRGRAKRSMWAKYLEIPVGTVLPLPEGHYKQVRDAAYYRNKTEQGKYRVLPGSIERIA